MAYSGTVGQTTISVQSLIDHGANRAGKLAEELTVEQVQRAKESLFYLLSNLINYGIQYWAINKIIYGLIPDQYVYYLPVGGNDVLNALYRTMSRNGGTYSSSAGGSASLVGDGDVLTYCQQTSANGSISIDFGAGQSVYIGSVGFMPYIAGAGSSTWSYVLEYSYDNSTWVTLATGSSVSVTDKQWVWTDIEPGANAQFYRMRATGGITLALRELYFGNNSTEIPMSRLNRDDYTNLPNKNFTANQPFQYWLNRTIPQAQITLWPTPQSYFYQAVVWYSSYVQDVGDLSGQLKIPDRWFLAIQSMLAHQMALELPQVPLDRITYLEGQSEKYFMIAEQDRKSVV